MQNHNDDTIIKTNEDFFKKKYTSHFIWKVCVWEGAGDRTELQHIDPHSYGHQCFVPVLLMLLNRRPWGPLCWVRLPLPHLVTNGSDLQTPSGVPRAPSVGWWLSLPHLVTNGSGLETNWLPVLTELYNSSTAHSISLEWHVWLSSSYGHQHCVFLVLQGCSTGGLGALPLWDMFSFQHLVINSSGLQLHRGSRGPLLLGGVFLYHILLPTGLISNSIGGLDGPFCWVVAFSTTSCL